MKIQLELEDFQFTTTNDNFTGENRWLLVKIGKRKFYVRRNVPLMSMSHGKQEWVDRFLVNQMETMLRKVFMDACESVPEGVDLTKPSQQPLRSGGC